MFKAYVPQQGELLPAHVGEALDPSDPALFIDDLVESLDLRRFEKRYRRRGERAFPPRMLLKLWLLGAVVGVYSGRELARRLHYDLRFRYLAAGLRPNFRTINRFRDRHHRDFREVFLQTLKVAQAMGLVKLGQVAVDGTKIRANTSRSKAMSHARMLEAEDQLSDEIEQIVAQMDELNAAEEQEHGDDDGGGGLPEELQLARATTGADPSGPGAAGAGERGEARSEAPEELRGPRSEHDEDRGILAVLLQRAAGDE